MLTRTLGIAWVGRRPERAAMFFYRWATGYVDGGNQFDGYPDEWKEAARAHARATLHELPQLLLPRPSSRSLRAITAPTTVVIGGRGRPVFRRTARAVARRIPDAESTTLPRSAHILNTDDPAGFAAAIEATLARTTR